jgi:CRISPR-associated protein Csm3
MQLTGISQIHATLELVTGLHIGSGDAEMHIGGTDSPVIKHPHTQHPYIPGSSIKGKMRSLLEWRSGAVQENPLGYASYKDSSGARRDSIKHILQLFGLGGSDKLSTEEAAEIGPSRLAFWDCSLRKEWVDRVRDNNQLLTEAKSENVINRISGTAEHPRNIERVPAGAQFDFRLNLKLLAGDGDELLVTVLQGLKLLELDGLGGSGSRGYGKLKLVGIKQDGVDINERYTTIQAFGGA